jgi:hypothetical protein
MRNLKRPLCLLPILLLALTSVSGCSATKAAYKAADGHPDKIAYVLTKQYTALVNEANGYKDSGVLTGAALVKVQAIDRKATPLLIGDANAVPPKAGLEQISQAYGSLKNAETEADLMQAIDAAAVVLSEFIDALQGVGK